MKIYVGKRSLPYEDFVVTVDGELLSIRHDVRNHSLDFSWGYAGSGPAQLALAILLDCLDNRIDAEKYYQMFKWDVIAKLNINDDWKMNSDAIKEWLKNKKSEMSHE